MVELVENLEERAVTATETAVRDFAKAGNPDSVAWLRSTVVKVLAG
jgi:hypothetical protein